MLILAAMERDHTSTTKLAEPKIEYRETDRQQEEHKHGADTAWVRLAICVRIFLVPKGASERERWRAAVDSRAYPTPLVQTCSAPFANLTDVQLPS